MNEDFEDILALLIDHNADFLIVGAHALAVHGVARATGDIDILVRPTRSNAERVCDALRAFGAPLGLHGVGPDELATAGNVYQLGVPPRRIDILTQIDGVSWDEAWHGHITVQSGDLAPRTPKRTAPARGTGRASSASVRPSSPAGRRAGSASPPDARLSG